MDARSDTRRVDRLRKPTPPPPPRGAKQIVIPMTRPLYDEIWHDPERIRAFVDGWARSAPELFPAGFDRGYWVPIATEKKTTIFTEAFVQ